LVVPPLCASRTWFGVPCPGCGLTRSFIHLAHGRWQASWQAHRLGWLLALLVLLQIPYRLYRLRWPQGHLLSASTSTKICFGLFGLLVVNWVVGLWLDL
jgi:hypothetical protein